MGRDTEIDSSSLRLPSAEAPAAAVYTADKRGYLQQLEASQATEILRAALRGQRYVDLNKCTIGGRCGRSRSRSSSDRDIPPSWDLKRMKHMNSKTGEEEDIHIEVPWNASMMKAIVGRDIDGSLRREVVIMALDRIRQTPVLQKILETKGLPQWGCRIKENPHLRRGYSLYEAFVGSLVALTAQQNHLCGHMIETASWEDDPLVVRNYQEMEGAGLRIVYHGTSHHVMDDILQQGLLPGPTHFFGLTHQVSREYTFRRTVPGEWKVLVFMVIGGFPCGNGRAMTSTVHKNELPIAEVTVPN